jgi:transposase
VSAPRKYAEETRARAVRMYFERIRDLGESKLTASDELKALRREVAELRRAHEILTTASAFFAQAELDRRLR